jgi:heterodisulfide reductase subunit C
MGALVLFLLAIVANALASRQPWVLFCYNCKACNSSCILGIDPQGFVDAALAGDPRIYIYTTNVRLRLSKAAAIDPNMVITVAGKKVAAHVALNELHVAPDTEVVTYRVQARNAARFCIQCGACERSCVLGLPLLREIDQLRAREASEVKESHAQ